MACDISPNAIKDIMRNGTWYITQCKDMMKNGLWYTIQCKASMRKGLWYITQCDAMMRHGLCFITKYKMRTDLVYNPQCNTVLQLSMADNGL